MCGNDYREGLQFFRSTAVHLTVKTRAGGSFFTTDRSYPLASYKRAAGNRTVFHRLCRLERARVSSGKASEKLRSHPLWIGKKRFQFFYLCIPYSLTWFKNPRLAELVARSFSRKRQVRVKRLAIKAWFFSNVCHLCRSSCCSLSTIPYHALATCPARTGGHPRNRPCTLKSFLCRVSLVRSFPKIDLPA